MPEPRRSRRPPKRHLGTSKPEAAVAALGALLVVGLVGYMLLHALSSPDGPPRFDYTYAIDTTGPDAKLVRFTIRNTGGRTAASVAVSVALSSDGQVVEEGDAEFDYVPQGASREGGIYFLNDPAAHDVTIRVTSFVRP
ncbi:hypothetical protein OCGS_0934 [Oceaniovalibus guishaninsula JLT2003]|uniref:TIGR02588 family protein n=1 Tax=Oceaniovalibus guishaninsula JLT2003 TaxID=1231392 RepID=K2HPX8_9RHOB|nr:hypothetical protein [Oceaniovalibus guishaninsula]EKE44899.1 hypothetical protein OCGS_0934 [Oceaniovalibus guishaninsula JLT2003]